MTKPLLSGVHEIFGYEDPEDIDSKDRLFGSYPDHEWSGALYYLERFGLPNRPTIRLAQQIGARLREDEESHTSGNTTFIISDNGEDRLSNEKYYWEILENQSPRPPDLLEDKKKSLKFLDNIPQLITKFGDVFEAYQDETVFKGINRFRDTAEIFREITHSITLQIISETPPRQWKVEIPDQYTEYWTGPQNQILRGFYGDKTELQAQMTRMAWSKFVVNGMSLYEVAKHFEIVMDFVNSVQYLHSNPNEAIQPQRHTEPKIIESTTGFQMVIKDLCYPPGLPIDASPPEIVEDDYALRHFVESRHQALRQAGIIESRQYEFHYPRPSEYTWKPGTTEKSIREVLTDYQHYNDEEYEDTRDLHQEAIELLIASSRTYQFIPFKEEIRFDEDHRIHIVSGPNKSGKTWRLDAIGYAVQEAQMGKWTATRHHEQSLVDQIYHSADIPEQDHAYSSFEALMKWIGDVLENATEDSLILIDEICRQTNHEYGLAIAWAITEEFHKRKFRARINTHIHQLSWFGEPNGERKLTGLANRIKFNTDPDRAKTEGVVTSSTRGDNFQTNEYPTSDSEAFKIARKHLPSHVMARAEELYDRMNQPRPIRYVLGDLKESILGVCRRGEEK